MRAVTSSNDNGGSKPCQEHLVRVDVIYSLIIFYHIYYILPDFSASLAGHDYR